MRCATVDDTMLMMIDSGQCSGERDKGSIGNK